MSVMTQQMQDQIDQAHALLKMAQSPLSESAAIHCDSKLEGGCRQTLRLVAGKERQEDAQQAQQQIDRIANERLRGAEALIACAPTVMVTARRRRSWQTV